LGTLDALADRCRDRVSFLAVYIKEAHPEQGWILPENRRSGVAVDEPRSDQDRRKVAASCATALRLRMPMVVDAVDNGVASAYGGWPDRLYLIGRDGRIAYRGGEGPFGFKPKELGAAIEQHLASGA
jgi:iodothyronine deiodinase-like protein